MRIQQRANEREIQKQLEEAKAMAIIEAPSKAEAILKDIINFIELQKSGKYNESDYIDYDFDSVHARRKKNNSYYLYRAPKDETVKNLLTPMIVELGYVVTESIGCYSMTCGFHSAGCYETTWFIIQQKELASEKKICYETDLYYPENEEVYC